MDFWGTSSECYCKDAGMALPQSQSAKATTGRQSRRWVDTSPWLLLTSCFDNFAEMSCNYPTQFWTANLGNWRLWAPSGPDSITECCHAIAATIPWVVQNALAKVQHKNMECTCKVQSYDMEFPLVGSIAGREWTYYPLVDRTSEGIGWGGVWILGLSMSRVRTQPLPRSGVVSGFGILCFFSSSSMEALALPLACLQYNASVIREGEVAKTATPPFRIITIATLSLLGFECGALSRVAPYTMPLRSARTPPPLSSRSENLTLNDRGGVNRTVTRVRRSSGSVLEIQSCFFVARSARLC